MLAPLFVQLAFVGPWPRVHRQGAALSWSAVRHHAPLVRMGVLDTLKAGVSKLTTADEPQPMAWQGVPPTRAERSRARPPRA